MSIVTEGGRAFPVPGSGSSYGMSLRDYFAAQALAGIMARALDGAIPPPIEMIAQDAYQSADAMIKAREGKL